MKTKTKLTSEQLKERSLKNLRVECNGLISKFRFGQLQTPQHFAEFAKLPTQDYSHVIGNLDLKQRLKFIELEDIIKRYYAFEQKRIEYGAPIARARVTCTALEHSRYPHVEIFSRIKEYLNIISTQDETKDFLRLAQELVINGCPRDGIPQTIPKQHGDVKVTLFPFQERAANEIWHWLFSTNHTSCLLEAPTGTGKTYIYGRVIRAIEDIGYATEHSVSPWPILLVTKATIVEQTKRVLRDEFGLDVVNRVHVINIEQLRASLGEIFIEETTTILNGEIYIDFKWRNHIHPVVIVWDECHILKNYGSTQSKIAQAYQKLLDDNKFIKQVFASATPFMCVAETKVFTISTRIPYLDFDGAKMPIRLVDFPSWSRQIAAPADPLEFSPAAMERYMKKLGHYIVSVKGVRPQFKAINSIKLIDFRSTKWRLFYNAAWQEYCEACAKINKELPGGQFMQLVEDTKFRIAAEFAHANEHMAEDAHAIIQQGYAAVIGCSYKPTVARTVALLVQEFGVPRDKISIIWGGATSLATKIMSDEEGTILLKRIAAQGDITDAELKRLEVWLKYKEASPEDKEQEQETRKLYSSLGLGPQSKQERQREIDRFQAGKTWCCIFTYKSGGVGLSLHHSDSLTKEKVRRQSNGWAVVEDIPLIPVRPRVTRLFPTYSAIEWAQGMGRAPRLTSLSDTYQSVIGYRGTVEVAVLSRASQKLKCLKKVVHTSEAFEGAIYEVAKGKTTFEQLKQLETSVDIEVTQEELGTEDNIESEDAE